MIKTNRSLGNFSEYRFKEKNNRCCFSPNPASQDFFKSLIMFNLRGELPLHD